jgi:hypothetical protein
MEAKLAEVEAKLAEAEVEAKLAEAKVEAKARLGAESVN